MDTSMLEVGEVYNHEDFGRVRLEALPREDPNGARVVILGGSDADKWDDFYERTKESDGMKSAVTDLANGFFRELKSRMEQAGPLDTPREIAQEVDKMWRDVADRHQELDPGGLSQLAKEMEPEVGELFE